MIVKQNSKLCVDHAFSHSAFEEKWATRKDFFKVSIYPCLLIHYYVLVLCSGFAVLSSAGNRWG